MVLKHRKIVQNQLLKLPLFFLQRIFLLKNENDFQFSLIKILVKFICSSFAKVFVFIFQQFNYENLLLQESGESDVAHESDVSNESDASNK